MSELDALVAGSQRTMIVNLTAEMERRAAAAQEVSGAGVIVSRQQGIGAAQHCCGSSSLVTQQRGHHTRADVLATCCVCSKSNSRACRQGTAQGSACNAEAVLTGNLRVSRHLVWYHQLPPAYSVSFQAMPCADTPCLLLPLQMGVRPRCGRRWTGWRRRRQTSHWSHSTLARCAPSNNQQLHCQCMWPWHDQHRAP